MNTTFMKLTRSATVPLIALTILAAGCKTDSDRTSGQKRGDEQVAKAIKKDLKEDPTFKYSDVTVNVYHRNVQLGGFVETDEQRLRAAEIASKGKGVDQVINQIMVKPSMTGPATIRDPLGNETGRIMLDTNSAPQQLRNIPTTDSSHQQQAPNGASRLRGVITPPSNTKEETEETTPK